MQNSLSLAREPGDLPQPVAERAVVRSKAVTERPPWWGAADADGGRHDLREHVRLEVGEVRPRRRSAPMQSASGSAGGRSTWAPSSKAVAAQLLTVPSSSASHAR